MPRLCINKVGAMVRKKKRSVPLSTFFTCCVGLSAANTFGPGLSERLCCYLHLYYSSCFSFCIDVAIWKHYKHFYLRIRSDVTLYELVSNISRPQSNLDRRRSTTLVPIIKPCEQNAPAQGFHTLIVKLERFPLGSVSLGNIHSAYLFK